MKQAKDTDPDVENLVNQCSIVSQTHAEIESHERSSKKCIDAGYQYAKTNFRNSNAIERNDRYTDKEIQIPQKADLSVRPVAGHRIPNRTQNVIRCHQYKNKRKGQHDRPDFSRLYFGH